MYDGAAFKNFNDGDRPKAGSHLVFPHSSQKTADETTTRTPTSKDAGLYIEITDCSTAVDDVIVECCRNDWKRSNSDETHPKDVSSTLPEVADYFESLLQSHSDPNRYAVIRRMGSGGTKTNKHLFEKLHLRRPHEGALCLLPSLWPCVSQQCKEETKGSSSCVSLEEDGLLTMDELGKISKVDQLLEFQLRPFNMLRSIVVTNDVLLADRVVKEGGAVLSYRQFEQALLW